MWPCYGLATAPSQAAAAIGNSICKVLPKICMYICMHMKRRMTGMVIRRQRYPFNRYWIRVSVFVCAFLQWFLRLLPFLAAVFTCRKGVSHLLHSSQLFRTFSAHIFSYGKLVPKSQKKCSMDLELFKLSKYKRMYKNEAARFRSWYVANISGAC